MLIRGVRTISNTILCYNEKPEGFSQNYCAEKSEKIPAQDEQ